jgi:aromatic ring-cleaving dioxygenase
VATELHPYHAHIYFEPQQRSTADQLHQLLSAEQRSEGPASVLFVGEMRDRPVGPHPKPQFEIHFHEAALPKVISLIKDSGLTALVHPLTEDDLADHTTLAQWIGGQLQLDLSVLDPPGKNQGVPRFGRTDF